MPVWRPQAAVLSDDPVTTPDAASRSGLRHLDCLKNKLSKITLPPHAELDTLMCSCNTTGLVVIGGAGITSLDCPPSVFWLLSVAIRAGLVGLAFPCDGLGTSHVSGTLTGFKKLKHLSGGLEPPGSVNLTGRSDVDLLFRSKTENFVSAGKGAVSKLIVYGDWKVPDLLSFTALTELRLAIGGPHTLDLSVCRTLIKVRLESCLCATDLEHLILKRCSSLVELHEVITASGCTV